MLPCVFTAFPAFDAPGNHTGPGTAADAGCASGYNKLGEQCSDVFCILALLASDWFSGTLYRKGLVDRGFNYAMALDCYKKADEQVCLRVWIVSI
jgi:hypothetical protein